MDSGTSQPGPTPQRKVPTTPTRQERPSTLAGDKRPRSSTIEASSSSSSSFDPLRAMPFMRGPATDVDMDMKEDRSPESKRRKA
eukprot:15496793-Heterocapsa_arctica.AAC.1